MRSNEAGPGEAGGALLAGVPHGLAAALGELLPATRLRRADDADAALAELGRGRVRAVLVEHGLGGGGGTRLVRRLRETPAGSSVPVLYCAATSLPVEEARELVHSLGVRRLLFHPLEAEAVAARLAEALREEALAAAVASARERFRGLTLRRLAALEEAAAALDRGALDPETRRRAEREAHKLAGSAGSFGSMEGTRLARSAELLLEGERPLGREEARALRETLDALRERLAAP